MCTCALRTKQLRWPPGREHCCMLGGHISRRFCASGGSLDRCQGVRLANMATPRTRMRHNWVGATAKSSLQPLRLLSDWGWRPLGTSAPTAPPSAAPSSPPSPPALPAGTFVCTCPPALPCAGPPVGHTPYRLPAVPTHCLVRQKQLPDRVGAVVHDVRRSVELFLQHATRFSADCAAQVVLEEEGVLDGHEVVFRVVCLGGPAEVGL